jgi:hypothetical protein
MVSMSVIFQKAGASPHAQRELPPPYRFGIQIPRASTFDQLFGGRHCSCVQVPEREHEHVAGGEARSSKSGACNMTPHCETGKKWTAPEPECNVFPFPTDGWCSVTNKLQKQVSATSRISCFVFCSYVKTEVLRLRLILGPTSYSVSHGTLLTTARLCRQTPRL